MEVFEKIFVFGIFGVWIFGLLQWCGSPSAAYPDYGEARRNAKMHHGGKGDLLRARTRKKEGWSREVNTAVGSGEHRRHHRGGHGYSGPHLGETAVPEVCYVEVRLMREFAEL
jgi:hypothetical protein